MALPASIEISVGKLRVTFIGRILGFSKGSVYVEDDRGEWTGWWPQAVINIL